MKVTVGILSDISYDKSIADNFIVLVTILSKTCYITLKAGAI